MKTYINNNFIIENMANKYQITGGYNKDSLKTLLEQFKNSHKKAKTLSNKLYTELININKQEKDILNESLGNQLSRWCHTGGSYKNSEPIAHQISIALFGEIIERQNQK